MTIPAEVHRSEGSCDEDEFEQAVTVTNQSERTDQVYQRSGGDRDASATLIMPFSPLIVKRILPVL